MTVRHQTFTSSLPVSAEATYAWHARDGAFERLTPPWVRVGVTATRGTIKPGDGKDLRIGVGPFNLNWTIEHDALRDGLGFADEQRSGPFREWRHTHHFDGGDGATSTLTDIIEWDLPLSGISQPLVGSRIAADMERLFRFRHIRTHLDLARHAALADQPPMTVAITGASGLVGRQLAAFLRAGGHHVIRISRAPARTDDDVTWDPAAGTIDAQRLDGIDAVVHLAGASISGGRWSSKRKHAIEHSRVDGTRLLVRTLGQLQNRPRVLVSASAVGYYGNRPGDVLTETSVSGGGFLADVCRQWEEAAQEATTSGIRVVTPRFGIVLSGYGGMLPLISRAFALGGGGPLGSGTQAMSWVALDDLIGILYRALTDNAMIGAVNAVSPAPVTNHEFTRTLASVLHRPAFFKVPAFALRAVAGELAEELLLTDQRVLPQQLKRSGFTFHFADLRTALRFELGKLGWQDTDVVPVS